MPDTFDEALAKAGGAATKAPPSFDEALAASEPPVLSGAQAYRQNEEVAKDRRDLLNSLVPFPDRMYDENDPAQVDKVLVGLAAQRANRDPKDISPDDAAWFLSARGRTSDELARRRSGFVTGAASVLGAPVRGLTLGLVDPTAALPADMRQSMAVQQRGSLPVRVATQGAELVGSLPTMGAMGGGITGMTRYAGAQAAASGEAENPGVAMGKMAAFGGLAASISTPLRAYLSRFDAVTQNAIVSRMAAAGTGALSFAGADAILHGPDGERALTNAILGAGLSLTGGDRIASPATTGEAAPPPQRKEAANAERQPAPSELHGDVSPQPQARPGEVPEPDGIGGVREGGRGEAPVQDHLGRAPAQEAKVPVDAVSGSETPLKSGVSTRDPLPTEANPALGVKPGETPVPREPLPSEPTKKPADLDALTAEVDHARAEGAGADLTSIKNRVVNEERAGRGLPPMEDPTKRPMGAVEAEAKRIVAEDPTRPESLARELAKKPRPITDVEDALLATRRVDLHKARERADEDVLAASARGDEQGVALAMERRDKVNEAFLEAELASRGAGTETARGLAARAWMMARDYSLIGMETTRRIEANKGKPLTPEQAAETRALHDRLAKAESERDAYAARVAEIEAKRSLGRIAERARKTTYGAENKIVTREAYEATKAAVREKMSRLSAGIDPTLLADLVKMGTFHVEAGARGFARWAKKMTAEAGDKVKPYLRDVWAEVGRQAPQTKDVGLAEAGKIAELVMREGVKGRDAVIDEVHSIIRESTPDVTRREVMDAISGYGKVRRLNPDPVKAELRELKGQMLQVAKLEDMAAGAAPLKTGLERQPPGDVQRGLIKEVNEAKRRGGYDVRDPASELRSALDATKTRLTHQITDLERQIATKVKDIPNRTTLALDAEATALRDRRDALKKDFDAVFGRRGLTDEQRLNALKTRTKNRIAELEKKTAAGDFTTKQRHPVVRDAEAIALEARYQTALKAWNEALFRDKMANETAAQKARRIPLEASNFARAVMTSFDVSAVLRQGGFVAFGHPIRAIKAMGPMFKALVSKEAQARSEAEITMRPNYGLARRSGLFLSEHGDTSMSKMEEAYMSRWAEKVPGVAASQRAYTTFLNRLRMDSFDAMVGGLSKNGIPTAKEAAAVAKFINVATGRGGNGREAVNLAGVNILFSPRLLMSRFQLIGGPFTGFQTTGGGSLRTRAMMAGEYARFLGGLAVVYGLAKLAGGDVETDPRSSDFGKIRFGNTRLDPLTGLSQETVLLSRLASGETKGKTGEIHDLRGDVKYGQGNAADAIWDFTRKKLAPVPGATVNSLAGENPVHQPTTVGKEALGLATPLSFTDIYKAMQDQGVPKGAALGILALFGMGLQTYSEDKKKNGPTPFKSRFTPPARR